MLAVEDNEASDSLDPCLRIPEVPRWITQFAEDKRLAGLLLTLCKGANKPNLGRHSKYLFFLKIKKKNKIFTSRNYLPHC